MTDLPEKWDSTEGIDPNADNYFEQVAYRQRERIAELEARVRELQAMLWAQEAFTAAHPEEAKALKDAIRRT